MLLGMALSFVMTFAGGGDALAVSPSMGDGSLDGLDTEYGITFSVRAVDNDTAGVHVSLGQKDIFLLLTYGVIPTASVQSVQADTGGAALLSGAESERIRGFLDALLRRNIQERRAGVLVLRVLNLLADWPPGLPVAYLSGPEGRVPAWTSACAIPAPTGLSESLCEEINLEHQGDYISEGLKIRQLPVWPYIPLFLPLWCTDVTEVVGPHPFFPGGCFGRCGRGCIGDGPPNRPLDIFTQNCFNHDACVGARGLLDDYCNQMFLYTVRDFLFGTNCQVTVADQ
jgi:hypothetical protein